MPRNARGSRLTAHGRVSFGRGRGDTSAPSRVESSRVAAERVPRECAARHLETQRRRDARAEGAKTREAYIAAGPRPLLVPRRSAARDNKEPLAPTAKTKAAEVLECSPPVRLPSCLLSRPITQRPCLPCPLPVADAFASARHCRCSIRPDPIAGSAHSRAPQPIGLTTPVPVPVPEGERERPPESLGPSGCGLWATGNVQWSHSLPKVPAEVDGRQSSVGVIARRHSLGAIFVTASSLRSVANDIKPIIYLLNLPFNNKYFTIIVIRSIGCVAPRGTTRFDFWLESRMTPTNTDY